MADDDGDLRFAGSGFGSSEILSVASRAKADAFIDKQNELADLQIEDLKRENKLRHWSLRVRHVSDVLKVAFELAIAFIVLALAFGLAAAIWQAAHADGLVIETINVPAAMAAKGLSGPVIAAKLLDRLNAMQADTSSLRPASSFSNDWTNDIKLEIPDTGISIGQVVRYLDNALGHQTHLSGEVYETSSGFALTIRLDDSPGQTFEGRNIDTLVQRATEAAYRQAQPYRYAVYLGDHGGKSQAIAIFKELAKSYSPLDRGWANEALAIYAADSGDFAGARAHVARVLEAIPNLPNAPGLLADIDLMLSHDEDALQEERRAAAVAEGTGRNNFDSEVARFYPRLMHADSDEKTGDFSDAIAQLRDGQSIVLGDLWHLKLAVDLARAHEPTLATSQIQNAPHISADPYITQFDFGNSLYSQSAIAVGRQDWSSAIKNMTAESAEADAVSAQEDENDTALTLRQIDPLLAWAYARAGDMQKANAVLAKLPADCYLCARMRGRVRAVQRDWGAAAYWFAQAARQAPSIPFAYADWGEMLLHKSDLDAAITKFKSANEKGPHFADPLEMWGEALIAKNRSDLALAKFEEAHKYAPNWGRLHLKWGEALLWAGKRNEAAQQFTLASRLDLTPAEKVKLAKARAHS
jgi:tetratricopeptide (TPR) repeat protein